MSIKRILIANRGEISIRVSRACGARGLTSVAVFSCDDAQALHRSRADEAIQLPGRGVAAYLDQQALIAAALETRCDAVHPGYGFLSESASFARACYEAGLVFVGPSPETLELFGNKSKALELARSCNVPVAESTSGPTSLADTHSFFADNCGSGVMIKALSGGGGRGMRVVHCAEDVEEAWQRCVSEASAAFGCGDLYAEALIGRARHIEIQIVGDGREVTHLFDRECSAQRRHQKLIEIAPSPWLPERVRAELISAAIRIGESVQYRGVGTVEFLVEIDVAGRFSGQYYFIELNPRIQVEHTVTEEVMGVDLVDAQLRIADGATLSELSWIIEAKRRPRGYALQLRINMETVGDDGQTIPSAGRLELFDLPSGAGVRVETAGYQGAMMSAAFDPLLAKIIAYSPVSFTEACAKGARALGEIRVDGVDTNSNFLRALMAHEAFMSGRVDTRFVESHSEELLAADNGLPIFYPDRLKTDTGNDAGSDEAFDADLIIRSPMQGQIISCAVAIGETFRPGQLLFVVEAMKMETAVTAKRAGVVRSILKPAGSSITHGSPVMLCEIAEFVAGVPGNVTDVAFDSDMNVAIEQMSAQHSQLLDEARPEAVELAQRRGAFTARERIEQLVDKDSFSEIGGLVRNLADGVDAPADGIVAGRASISCRPVLVLSQDFSVFGGSAGHLGMTKMERIAALAKSHGLPLIMLLDGGGHRIQDGQNSRDYAVGAPLFQQLVDLSGWVPVVVAILGAGFAANTNFAGCADFVVMVRDRALMGLAGPALVKAGTGEVLSAEELGGAAAQVDRNGLAHLGVANEQEALAAIRQYLSYLPSNAGLVPPSTIYDHTLEPNSAALTSVVPANSRRTYDVRDVIRCVADEDSLFEIKPTHAANLIVGFGRMEGRPVGFIANQPLIKGGMLDAQACEKGAHFISICDAFGLPLIFLIDVPGFSIGPSAERSLLGRRSARMIHELGCATVPRISVVIRKGYGLGYIAMCGGRSFAADLAIAWPSAEICAMSVEGSVDVAYRKDYEAALDPRARRAELIDGIRSRISPLQAAEGFGLDDIVAPDRTRARILEVLTTAPPRRDHHLAGRRRISPI